MGEADRRRCIVPPVSKGSGLGAIETLHAEADEVGGAVASQHRGRLQCRRGCSGCCVDGITVFEVEAERILARHSHRLATEAPGPEGACAFLDPAGACRIYEERPYVCRTQGLPLRWNDEDAEYRDICPLNEPGPPLVSIPASACFELGPFEARLAGLQASRQGLRPGASLARVALRSLFSKG